MRPGGHGHHEVVSLTLQAVIAIVAFFALAFGLAVTLKTFGTAVFVVVVTALLTVALILQTVSESHWPAYAAIALALLAVVSRFAFEAAVLNDDRRSRRR
jgi:4-amino-4-deoxy-L-arabinose transferase-like glycosyltransferase